MKYSYGVMIYRQSSDGIQFLCLRCYQNWDFPKGEADWNETPMETAIREVLEETQLLANEDYVCIGQNAPSIVYGNGGRRKTATYFLAESCSLREPQLLINPELGKPEHDEWRWVLLSELSSVLPKRFEPIIAYLQGHFQA